MTSGPRRRRVDLADDSGATLILALIIVTVVSLVVTAILGFADTSLRTTVAMRSQAATTATGDGAVQAAINTLRRGTYDNDTSSATMPNCFGNGSVAGTQDAGKTLLLSNLVPGGTGTAPDSAAVRCEPDPATGAAGGVVPITAANKPGNAILTLSTNSAEDGLNVKANSTTVPFNVHGGIVSNSNIAVVNGSLQSNTGVYARGACTGTIVSTPAPACGFGGALPGDPGYASDLATVPAYQPVPASCSSVTAFSPGYYDDAKALSDLMGSAGCKNTVWWFQPGTYYFDFQNATKSAASMNAHQWTVGVGQLVAGTPVNSGGAHVAQPASPATVPGACANPIHDVTAVGVQFVFGGDSQLQVAGTADAEICGSYSSTRPPLAVYGLSSGKATPTTATYAATAATTTVTGTTTGFTAPAGGTLADSVKAAADGKVDTFTTPGTTGKSPKPPTAGTATLSLSGTVPAAGIPAGSNLTSAKLRIVYGTSGAANARSVTVTPVSTAGAGTAITPATAVALTAQTAGTTQTFDLLSGLQQPAHDLGLTDLKIGYSTSLAAGTTETVDAVLLDLTYTAPALEGETTAAVPGNCLAIPYTQGVAGTGKCAVLYTATNYKGSFYVQGTTYTPLAPIDIALSNITEQVLRFGVISRVLDLWETGAVSYQGPVIEIPEDSPGYGIGDTVVYLSATVCPGSSSCAYDATKVALRARVYIHDPTGAPVAGSRQMTVQSWSEQR